VNSPTYIGFTHAIERCGRFLEHSPLVRDADGVWRMDYDDMDRRIREHDISLVVFCSPLNPCGRVWERWELERAMELFEKYQCAVICDEIWSDLILPGHTHIPAQQVSPWAHDNTIALYAPSKTFNLAGLIGSYHVIYDQRLRDRVRSVADSTHYNSLNVLSQEALVGAYSEEGDAWLEELLQVIDANMTLACDFFGGIEGVSLMRPEGTYMLFVDFAGWLEEHGKTLGELEEAAWRVGVAWQEGAMFHGPTHIRMNLALPTARLQEALDRLARHVL
jgi:cystathionine beta-lyase